MREHELEQFTTRDWLGIVAFLILSKLANLEDKLDRVIRMEKQEMADLTAISAAVENNTSVDESAIALLGQLADLIRQNATDPAALAALADSINGEASNLAAAVSANTPAAPPAPTT